MTLNEARSQIARASSVVAFSGAGLSAESGVATFRDAATDGHWTKHDPMRLASPDGFRDDPELVLRWYGDRRRQLAAAQPNPAHHALAASSSVLITQNVDDLLERAGATDVIHLHGTLGRDRCDAACGYSVAVDLAAPPLDGRFSLQECPECRAPLRPAVVWFGETLPQDAWEDASQAAAGCDVLLVIGTAAEVFPAAGLVDVARAAGATTIVVNTQPSRLSRSCDVEFLGPAGTVVPKLFG